LNEGIRLKNVMRTPRGMTVREAHKWRSHKKNEPKLVSSNNQESLKHFQKRN